MKRGTSDLAIFGGPKAVTQPAPPYPVVDHDELSAAMRVILSRGLSDPGRGEFVAAMEDQYAAYFGARYCLSFASGTAALHGALFAVGVRPGAEVLTCNHNWISGITAILHAGGTPVLCDVQKDRWHIDPAEIPRKATPNTRAVVVTHLWGVPADMDRIVAACRRANLPLIEDVSHAHGGKYKGRYLGTIGDVGIFSLQGSKAITAGEGGFLLTDSKRYFQRAAVPGHHGMRLSQAMTLKELRPFAPGGGVWTYRIAPIAAAIACAQLRKLPVLNAARQANFDRLHRRLRRLGLFRWPALAAGSVRGWYGTPALFDEAKAGVSRDAFVRACRAEGAGIGGEGYCDWSQIPLFQDMRLFSQMFVPRHANGVAFRPVVKGELPHYDRVQRSMVLFQIPAVESPALMDQCAEAVEKVAANLPALRRAERRLAGRARRRRGGRAC